MSDNPTLEEVSADIDRLVGICTRVEERPGKITRIELHLAPGEFASLRAASQYLDELSLLREGKRRAVAERYPGRR